MKSGKYIYFFNQGQADGSVHMKDILGGKGANLAEMSRLNLPVPCGFTITTELCSYYYSNHKSLPQEFLTELNQAILQLEKLSGKNFGQPINPLLISVRSGAKDSMPGMMDTILNLGLNDNTVLGLAKETKKPDFAFDSYLRFIQFYSDVVLGIPYYHFEHLREEHVSSGQNLQELCTQYKELVISKTGTSFPQEVNSQLIEAIKAVLESWMSPRAVKYRKIKNIYDAKGTAITIQSMVFGNMGNTSGTGVAFTRNPSTGSKQLFGEFLINAQGEDVVAGIRTPAAINGPSADTMEQILPELYREFAEIAVKLENYYKDMQDIEFTIENGKLYILQTRSGKRSASAAVKIAVDLVEEGLISKEAALLSIEPESLHQLLHARIDKNHNLPLLTKGLPASPGAATGAVVFSAEEAENLAPLKDVILVRNDTSPEDIKGMYIAKGVLTARGGMTSHAAVVARGMGVPCVCGAHNIKIDYSSQTMKIGNQIIKAGDIISLEGSSGEVILGSAPLIAPEFSEEFQKIMEWSQEFKKLGIRANAETVLDSTVAMNFGAEGIGLCRTEHMFFDMNQIEIVRQMILALEENTRREAIAKLLPIQTESFSQLFRLMKDLPVNIRLLDPPLHEFLPHNSAEEKYMAEYMNIPLTTIQERMQELKETNPMLGHRGCRLGITFPEIYEMQVQAIFAAASIVQQELQIKLNLEIMVPLISTEKEFEILKAQIENIYHLRPDHEEINFKIGTMIELPRAALRAKQIAQKGAAFFSFGTNDLTQTTYGISRDDIASFLPAYQNANIFNNDPFSEIDEEGVGELIKLAAEYGKLGYPDIKMGICGEHGGNPKSIYFCHKIGLDYVSCSPYRIPIAKLAAAQAALLEQNGDN